MATMNVIFCSTTVAITVVGSERACVCEHGANIDGDCMDRGGRARRDFPADCQAADYLEQKTFSRRSMLTKCATSELSCATTNTSAAIEDERPSRKHTAQASASARLAALTSL